MPTYNDNYNEYVEKNTDIKQSQIDSAINYAKSDLDNLQSEILGWKKVSFKTPDSINNFYRLEGLKVIFQLDQVRSYLDDVYKSLSWMKVQKFSEVSKEKNFTGTILAIQIALKAMSADPKNPKNYNIPEFNWEYNDITKEAIKAFQSDQNIESDWKPWKWTIQKLIKAINNLIDNKKRYLDIKNIVRNSFNWYNVPISSLLELYNDKEIVNAITDYIIKWNLWTNLNPNIEAQINNLARNPSNLTLQNLINDMKENNKLNILNKDERFKNTKYDNLIVQFSKKYSNNHKIDPALIKIIVRKESKFNPNARSWVGAQWLMQLMPNTAKWLWVKNAYDYKENLEGGTKLFSKLLNKYNWDIPLALAAYNAGSWNVEKFWNKIPPFKETQNYVKDITSTYNSLA